MAPRKDEKRSISIRRTKRLVLSIKVDRRKLMLREKMRIKCTINRKQKGAMERVNNHMVSMVSMMTTKSQNQRRSEFNKSIS